MGRRFPPFRPWRRVLGQVGVWGGNDAEAYMADTTASYVGSFAVDLAESSP